MQYLKDKAYEILREKIINCEYAPGTLLTETLLIEEIGASRTPIRDAINRLAFENLVMIIPKKGIIVKGITLNDVVQVLETRLIIEPQIVLRYGNCLEKSTLYQYRKQYLATEKLDEKIKLDEEFHKMIYNVCSNRYLLEILNMVEGHNHRNRIWRSNESRVNESRKEHLDIVDAILADNYTLAAEKMQIHIENAKEYAIRKYL